MALLPQLNVAERPTLRFDLMHVPTARDIGFEGRQPLRRKARALSGDWTTIYLQAILVHLPAMFPVWTNAVQRLA